MLARGGAYCDLDMKVSEALLRRSPVSGNGQSSFTGSRLGYMIYPGEIPLLKPSFSFLFFLRILRAHIHVPYQTLYQIFLKQYIIRPYIDLLW